MSATKPTVEKGKAKASPSRSTTVSVRPGSSSARTIRETIESIVIAFILAFLFRTFEAEAFVIPTGSMAPTLQGMHKDVNCPKCGYRYRVSASDESDDETEPGVRQERESFQDRQTVAGTCPMCRFQNVHLDKESTYKGDFILVGKFPYDFFPDKFSQPKRWDVIVFCFPGGAKTNYIKRLIGLPGEIVRIEEGDIYISQDGGSTYDIARKPPGKVQAMLQTVYDNDIDKSYLQQRGWPNRWQVFGASSADSPGWKTDDNTKSFQTESTVDETWIRYQHFVPSPWDWDKLVEGPLPAPYPRPAQLITDFYAYNTNVKRRQLHAGMLAAQLGQHWVGDLALECEVTVKSPQGELALDLVKGGRHFTCRVDLSNGHARFGIDGIPESTYAPMVQTSISSLGTYRLKFANVDQQLLLWVDGSLVVDPELMAYAAIGNNRPVATSKNLGDLAPAGIGARSASVQVDHLKIHRDIYYVAAKDQSTITELNRAAEPFRGNMTAENLVRFLSDPSTWGSRDSGRPSPFDRDGEPVEFELKTGDDSAYDQFFVLGDNSPASKDGRLWQREFGTHYVERKLLIGKAMFIYWPHSFNRIPGTTIPLPYFPNFSDMGFVR